MKKLTCLYLFLLVLFTGFTSDASADEPKVKHIFIFIGDGMGYNQEIVASQWYTGQNRGFGYHNFSFAAAQRTFPRGGHYNSATIWSSFYTAMNGATDSAAAGTAMATGEKTYNGRIGVSWQGQRLRSVFEAAEVKGLSSGVVTSVQISHATPAAFTAHNKSRNNYEEIAREMLAGGTDVILGCGHPLYDDHGKRTAKADHRYVGGKESFSRLRSGKHGRFITTRKEFQRYMTGKTPDRLIGVARTRSSLQFYRPTSFNNASAASPFADDLNQDVPTLEEMTRVALNVLDENEKGFIIMVEGGAIDKAGHANNTARLVEESVDFANAIDAAIDWVSKNSNWEESVMIVTADHETGYLIAAGSGTAAATPKNRGIGTTANVNWKSGGHTNHLVPFYAEGKYSQGFTNFIKGTDKKRGRYLDNTAIARRIFALLGE